MNPLRQVFTVALLILALTGIQVLQHSPLHNHLVHVADCTLCHHDGTESVPVTGLALAAHTPATPFTDYLPQPCQDALLLAFSSRAPPRAFT